MTPVPVPVARRDVLLAGALGVGAAAGLWLKPDLAEAAPWGTLERVVPGQIGPYRLSEHNTLAIPIATPMLERTYTDVLTRLYVAPGLPAIMLLIALGDGGDTGLAMHRPEECYPAAGFAISEPQRAPVGGVPNAGDAATIVTATRGEWSEQVYFWVRVGTLFPASSWGQRLATMRYDLSGRHAMGALVRLSTIGDRPEALKALVRFNAELLKRVPPEGRQLIAGGA